MCGHIVKKPSRACPLDQLLPSQGFWIYAKTVRVSNTHRIQTDNVYLSNTHDGFTCVSGAFSHNVSPNNAVAFAAMNDSFCLRESQWSNDNSSISKDEATLLAVLYEVGLA